MDMAEALKRSRVDETFFEAVKLNSAVQTVLYFMVYSHFTLSFISADWTSSRLPMPAFKSLRQANWIFRLPAPVIAR